MAWIDVQIRERRTGLKQRDTGHDRGSGVERALLRNAPPRPVLVLDGEGRNALAVTRALGRNGIPVVVAAEQRRSLAGVSRFAERAIRMPSPEGPPDEYLDAVAAAVQQNDIGVVMPASEVALELLLADPARVQPATLPFGPGSAFDVLNDKCALYRLARELEITTPNSVIVESATTIFEQLPAIAALGYPVVLKPYRSRIPVNGGFLRATVQYADSESELLAAVQDNPVFRDHPFLVQEKIDGHGAGVFLLTDGAEVRTCFGHRRLRERPPNGGESVLAKGVIPEASMRHAAEALLRHTGWRGVAMAEFKVDREGTPHLLEVNARFWGSLQLAIDSGVNFPLQLYRVALGLDLSTEHGFLGRKNRWFAGDLSSLFLTVRSEVPVTKKIGAVGNFIRTTLDPRISSAVFQWDDPVPAGMEYWAFLRNVARRRGR